MTWVVLFVAGLLEVGWAVGLKYTQGFTKLWPSFGTIGAMVVSFYLLSQALKTIPVGTGYAVWTGIGAVGTVILGMAFLGEPRDVGRIVCLLLIIGLKVVFASLKQWGETFQHRPNKELHPAAYSSVPSAFGGG